VSMNGEVPQVLQIPNGIAWQAAPSAWATRLTPDGRGMLFVLRQPNTMCCAAWTRSELTALIDAFTKARDVLPPDGLEIARGPLPPGPLS